LPNDLWLLWAIAHDDDEIAASQFLDELEELTGHRVTQPTLTRWNGRWVNRERIDVDPSSGRGQTSIYKRRELVGAALALVLKGGRLQGTVGGVMLGAISVPRSSSDALSTLWSLRSPSAVVEMQVPYSAHAKAFRARAATIEALSILLAGAPETVRGLEIVQRLLGFHNYLRTEPVVDVDTEFALSKELGNLVREWARTPAPKAAVTHV
jgi:hypothetical protein